MAYNVKFLKGTAEGYKGLAVKDANTFYFTGADLYLGEIKLSSDSDLKAALTRVKSNEDAIALINEHLGDLGDLKTNAKNTVVAAINEVFDAVGTGGTASVVTVEEDTTSADYAKVYQIKQGGEVKGTINIPKDMVVESGSVVVNPEGQPAGTYIKLVLANAEKSEIFVNVGTLVDIYTAKAEAAQVQLAIDAKTREISATIVAGGVGTAELANDAVTTVKIKDANVTKAKLANDVQTSLGKADSAVQTIATGTKNGSIAVDGTDVDVKGLGSAAYKADTAFDTAGAAAGVKTEVVGGETDAATAPTIYGAKAYADAKIEEAAGNYDASGTAQGLIDALDVTDTAVANNYVSAVSQTDGKIKVTRAALPDYTEVYDAKGAATTAETNAKAYADSLASNYDAKGSAAAAETNAKAYTDTALTWGSF